MAVKRLRLYGAWWRSRGFKRMLSWFITLVVFNIRGLYPRSTYY